jgi:hypothetical protein
VISCQQEEISPRQTIIISEIVLSSRQYNTRRICKILTDYKVLRDKRHANGWLTEL